MRSMLEKGAIWVLIALFLTNQIAGNTIDFKMNAIKVATFFVNKFKLVSNFITKDLRL